MLEVKVNERGAYPHCYDNLTASLLYEVSVAFLGVGIHECVKHFVKDSMECITCVERSAHARKAAPTHLPSINFVDGGSVRATAVLDISELVVLRWGRRHLTPYLLIALGFQWVRSIYTTLSIVWYHIETISLM